jgi:AcrR family transcriptional regulator
MARKIDSAKRIAILKAAREIFKERSYSATPVSEIAHKAGIATGTFYLYFKSKLDVVDALCDYYLMDQIQYIAASVDERDIRLSISRGIHAALVHASENADLVRLIDLRRSHLGRNSRPPADRNVQKMMRGWLSTFVSDGVMYPYNPRIMAELITGLIEWISKICFAWYDLDPHRYEDTVIELLQRALIIDYKG